MRILIVEDEYPTAEYSQRLCHELLPSGACKTELAHDLPDALQLIHDKKYDLCLLDLNLHGDNGYDLLKTAAAQAFHTIIISAYPDQAITAFQYGVLDFIVKPFGRDRLQSALDRYLDHARDLHGETKFLCVRDQDSYTPVNVSDIVHIRSDGPYVRLYLKNGKMELLLKSMKQLELILPAHFFRAHRSHFININEIDSFGHSSGGSYKVKLKNHSELPLSRKKYKDLFNLLN